MKILGRLLCAVAMAVAVAAPAGGQSLFYFPRLEQGGASSSRLTVTNPSSGPAEVQFELFGLNGPLTAPALGRVRYRLEAGRVLSMPVDRVFATGGTAGWIRVRSKQSGLSATLLAGDFIESLEAVPAAVPMTDQLVALPAARLPLAGNLRAVNPSEERVALSVTVFDSQGNSVSTFPATLEAHAGIDFDLSSIAGPPGAWTARINASRPVLAQAALGSNESRILLSGLPAAGSTGSFWVAPHVVSGSGFESTLVLSNPAGQAITVFVTLLSASGGATHPSQSVPRRHPFNIPANGAVSIGAAQLTGLVIAPTVNGWIQVESPNLALAGTLVISRAAQRTAYPLEPIAASERMYPQTVGLNTELAGLVLANLGDVVADIELVVLDKEGFTLARSSVAVGARAKRTPLVGDLFPGVNLSEGRMLVLRSATPIYGALLAEAGRGLLAAARAGAALPELDRPASLRPRIVSMRPEQVQPGDRVRLLIEHSGFDFTLLLGGRPVTVRHLAPGIPLVEFEVPNIKAGFVDLTIRSADGTVSRAHTLRVEPSDAPPFREVLGRAFYEKVDIGPDGLDPSLPVLVPIRDAVVEVFARVSNQVFSAGYTDPEGAFRVLVPHGSEYAVRVLSRSSSSDVLVANNTNAGTIYTVNSDVDAARPPVLIASDANRISGAFNILEVIRQGNALLRRIDVNLSAPELGIFWSPANTPVAGDVATGQIGGTFFSAGNNTAFILGDRTTDSDEFDDAVILHEYAHGLAERFSRDDSRGGPHTLGDVLDPRMAWSEGWANFFSALVRADPIYRDSRDLGGSLVLEYDLEENVPAGDSPGYRSEFSVHSMLWDLVDDIEDAGDVSEIPLAPIWKAFVGLKDDRFVYLPSFLDRLVGLVPSETFGIEQIARQRGIDYIAGADPSVSNPFPQPVSGTEAVTGEVDSLSRGRANLAQSAHQYVFDVRSGAVSLRLDITGVGPGGNPTANDLDLFLMDLEGRILALSDRGLNGQSELISTFLPAGRYVVEVRSFYTHGDSGALVFNAGAYRLEFSLP